MSVLLRFPSKPLVRFVKNPSPFGGHESPALAALLPPTVIDLTAVFTPEAAQWTAPSTEFLCQLTAMTTTAPVSRGCF